MRMTSSRSLRQLGLVFTLAAFAACDTEPDAVDTTADPDLIVSDVDVVPVVTNRWTTNLEPMGGSGVSGNASVMPGAAAGQMTAQVAVTGAPANGVHPWHVHVGTCGSGGEIYGPAGDYPPLTVDANGTASATATVNVVPPTAGDYHVNVHLSGDQLGTIVACGNLTGAM